MRTPAKPIAYTVDDASRIAGIGVTKLYEEIGAGALDARKAGRRTVIMAASLDAYLANLPSAKIRAPRKAA